MKLVKKDNYYGYADYFYPKAKWLEENCHVGTLDYKGPEADIHVNDELMQNTPVYNTVSRTQEGFNHVLDDLWEKDKSKLFHKKTDEKKAQILRYRTESWDETTWIWNFLFHRVTGSGFSGREGHGYHNNIVQDFGELGSIDEMIELVREKQAMKEPPKMISTVGNIVPFPRKGQGVLNYLCTDGVVQAQQLQYLIGASQTTWSIKQATDRLNAYNTKRLINRWNFPFSMTAADIATYLPNLVDPNSEIYCGKNAYDAIAEMYEKPKGLNKEKFCDVALEELTDDLGTTPMAHEDTLCIYIRFLENTSRYGDYKNQSGYTRQNT